MLTLYHHPMSAGSRYVRLILGEYSEAATLAEEQFWQRRDGFLALNAACTVPVLVKEGASALCGATVIAEFIDETIGALKREQRLLPENSYLRAEARRIADWSLDKLEHEVTRYLVTERVFKRQMRPEEGGGSPDSQAIRAARTNIKYHLKYLSWLADTRDWLAGDAISYADLAGAGALSVLDYLGEIEWDANPPLKDWYARMKSRPSFRPLLSDKVKGLPPVSHYVDLDF